MFVKPKNIEGIFLPLQGPSGIRPKAPAVGGWQSPGYRGLDELGARTGHRLTPSDWFGMRCDGYVVIDPDCQCPKTDGNKPAVCVTKDAAKASAELWLAIDPDATKTWVRKTPHGLHFIYAAGSDSPDAPNADILGEGSHVDIRAGRTSQIVFHAPGYFDLTEPDMIRPFVRSWLPTNFGSKQIDRSNDESWDEMPEGRGNNTMAAFAGAFRKQGMSPVTIAKCLGAINKITMTDDPMPIEMIVEIARSVGRYAARPDIDIEVEE